MRRQSVLTATSSIARADSNVSKVLRKKGATTPGSAKWLVPEWSGAGRTIIANARRVAPSAPLKTAECSAKGRQVKMHLSERRALSLAIMGTGQLLGRTAMREAAITMHRGLAQYFAASLQTVADSQHHHTASAYVDAKQVLPLSARVACVIAKEVTTFRQDTKSGNVRPMAPGTRDLRT